MQGYKTADILNPFFQMPDDKKELEKVYRTLAKSADQRLLRLERYSEQEDFKNITKWAYAKAMNDIQRWSGSNANRFNTAPPKNKLQLIAKINDITSFLESATSTKAGIVKMFKKRADTINDKYGTNFSWTDLGEFFESEYYQNLENKFKDSNTILIVLGEMQANKEKVLEGLKSKSKRVEYVATDQIQKRIEKAMRDKPAELKKFL